MLMPPQCNIRAGRRVPLRCHGALAKQADLVAWREMLVTSRDRIETLVKEGKTEQEVLAAKPLHDLDAKWAANDQQAQNWTRMVYNSFTRS